MGANADLMDNAPALADDAPHLLVVDDDRRIRNLLSRFLLGEGYRVTTAGTAAEARSKLSSLRFDLLILDVMMPGQTGFEFARELRASSSVPILMLTARGELKRAEEIIRITDRERDMLRLLAAAPGETVTREELAGNNGNSASTGERAVDVQINRLRRKIERDPTNPMLIQTVRGIGYRLVIAP